MTYFAKLCDFYERLNAAMDNGYEIYMRPVKNHNAYFVIAHNVHTGVLAGDYVDMPHNCDDQDIRIIARALLKAHERSEKRIKSLTSNS